MDETADSIARGLRKKWHSEAEGFDYEAFMPEDKSSTEGDELSIDWIDEEDCVAKLLARKAIAAHGVATVHLPPVIEYITTVGHVDKVSVGRSPLDENRHHGYIRYPKGVPTKVRRMIAGVFALGATLVQ